MTKNNIKHKFFHYLAVYGCWSTALVYIGIGAIAFLSFFRLKEGGADEASMMVFLWESVAGKAAVIIILGGMTAYVVWRFYEAFADPYDYGGDREGILKRAGAILSSITDGFIAFSALTALTGTATANVHGIPSEEREAAGDLLEKEYGPEVLMTLGIVVISVAVIQFIYLFTFGYTDRIKMSERSFLNRLIIHFTGWAGHTARGVIIGVIGGSMVLSVLRNSGEYIVNTDKAFDFVGDDVGHCWFLALAGSTICYGVFMFYAGMLYKSFR